MQIAVVVWREVMVIVPCAFSPTLCANAVTSSVRSWMLIPGRVLLSDNTQLCVFKDQGSLKEQVQRQLRHCQGDKAKLDG
jgi:hypothetical protein